MIEFRLWAPDAADAHLVLDEQERPMEPRTDGWFALDVPATHGARYGYRLDGGPVRPDPRGPWLPDGVHAPGKVYDHSAFPWSDTAWAAPAWPDALVYELHVGTFTPLGTLDAAVERLDYLRDLGVTHVELMPVCAFDGVTGWGYDGVAPWSVHEPYGGPDGLKRFVDAAHATGLAVVLDVVHNHLGPSGNYLSDFGPYFTDRVSTPWGDAVNLDGPGSDEVRAYLLGSVEAWLRDFHIDGLRLDAIHELRDERALTFLEELTTRVDALSSELGRPLVTVAESDRNDPRTVTPRDENGLGMTAQWSDDVHHALHTWLTGEGQGYYADFAVDPSTALRAVYADAFFHAGTYSSFRGRTHGRRLDAEHVPGSRFVASLQTHDQVGNRANGERLTTLVPPGHLAAGAALLLLGPFVPMLFMGEEWGASTPWLFFTSYPDEGLAQAVTHGRRSEFAEHGWSAEAVPDPQDPTTFTRSRLDWSQITEPGHAELLAWYRTLIAMRREHPELRDPTLTAGMITVDASMAVVRRSGFTVVASIAQEPREVELEGVSDLVAALPSGHAGPELVIGPRTRVVMPAGSVALLR
jgi:maltooligosyltrehalose trehalohydrolase